ncbi:hypothetical protein [Oryzicola mucosus]|uniref:Uncharacterized protein n=1 Tax=Oryzicola mucosus TaxID=2767425 RepID=A0A8J6PH20_9HYPH|nr:hypothetical protein [Oryzicola mucosus]MBD0413241.1 hypothetical protein [Oryzicola mucosus]
MSNSGVALFQPKLSRNESKADLTTRVAREIIDTEAAKREAKTEKLRLARMLATPEVEEVKPKTKAKAAAKPKKAAKK